MPRPGQSKKYGSGYMDNANSDNLVCISMSSSVKISVHSKDDPNYPEPGPVVSITLAAVGKAGRFNINLSNLSEKELAALKEALDTAFEWAEPVAKARDNYAQEVYDNGGDSFDRIYRSVPTLHHRKGISEEHRQGLFDRPQDAPEVGTTGPDPAG